MAAKLAVLAASVVSAVIGVAVLWIAGRPAIGDEDIVRPTGHQEARAARHMWVRTCRSAESEDSSQPSGNTQTTDVVFARRCQT
jgi:hypothetical protein